MVVHLGTVLVLLFIDGHHTLLGCGHGGSAPSPWAGFATCGLGGFSRWHGDVLVEHALRVVLARASLGGDSDLGRDLTWRGDEGGHGRWAAGVHVGRVEGRDHCDIAVRVGLEAGGKGRLRGLAHTCDSQHLCWRGTERQQSHWPTPVTVSIYVGEGQKGNSHTDPHL